MTRLCVVCGDLDALVGHLRCWKCKKPPKTAQGGPKVCDPNRDWAAYFADRTIETSGGCHIWQLRLDRAGYGKAGHQCAGQSVEWSAHRLAWTALRGVIPDGLTIHHLCFTPACVNPNHMQLLSNVENARLQSSALKTHCVNGHEFTEANTNIQIARNGRPHRSCRTCRRNRKAA